VRTARAVGRYEILRELGRGGTATVYLARQNDLGRLVALKELSALPVADPATAKRFVRESRLTGGLNHPNIVTVHDYFEDNGTPYIAMEYLERGSLRPVVRRLTFAQIAGVLEGVLAGLGHAQEKGIVHRDLKPENLMITADGRIKIADFGIAKVTDEAQAGTVLTLKGTTIGTPTYMAPEQALAGNIGPWTDLYAVGVIAFELLAGRTPFDTSGSPMSILLRHVNEPPLELMTVAPSVDPRLSDWIDMLLVKDPEKRRRSAGTAWMALEEVVLDRLGSRWRRSARLLDTAPTARVTPTTMTLPPVAAAAGFADDDELDQRMIPTAAPRVAAPASAARVAAAGAAAAAAAARLPPARALGRLAGLLMVVLLVVAVLAMAIGNMTGGGRAPSATPASDRSAQPQRTADPAGVGDSQSDDPSDDEPDVGEP
jgi:serine/threonine protein kinase